MNRQRLKDYLWIKNNIENMELEILNLEARATTVTPNFSYGPVAKGYMQDKTANLVAAIIDKRFLLLEQFEKLCRARAEIEESIAELPEREKYLMRARYLYDKPWEKIAEEMCYSLKQIHRIHSNALKDIR